MADVPYAEKFAWLASRKAGLKYWLDVHDPVPRLASAALPPGHPVTLLREQGRRLNTQVKPLDVDLAVGAIARNDQKAEPVDMALKISIGLFAGLRNST